MTPEEVVEMLVYFARQQPEMFYKYSEDDDEGRSAFESFVNNYISSKLTSKSNTK